MMSRVAVIGAGMTRFVRRAEETPGELAAHAVQMALEDAGLTIDDIDAVCLGTAPDAFDGIHMNGENLIAGAGATKKPYLRHFVGGGTGVMSPIHGWMHVASGKFNNCLVVTEEKMSPCVPHPAGAFLTIFDHTTEQPLYLTLIHIFAMEMARFMHAYGYTEEEIARISVQHKKNALDHPAAQIGEEITVADVMNSKMLSTPVKRYDISPTSDGARRHRARQRACRALALQGAGLSSTASATASTRPTGARVISPSRPTCPWRRATPTGWPGSSGPRTRLTSGSPMIPSPTRRCTT